MDMRQYDNAIGRWVGQDPISHHSTSPYSAMENNPAYWADPSGADVTVGANSYDFTGQDAQNLFGLIHYLTNPTGSYDVEDEHYTATFTAFVELPELIIGAGGNKGGGMSVWATQIENHVYTNSPYYHQQYFKMVDPSQYEQNDAGLLGFVAGEGEINGIVSIIKAVRNWREAAALAKTAAILEKQANLGVEFGKTENQIYHAFRHTDELRLDRQLVQSAILDHFSTVSSKIIEGKPLNSVIEISGQQIQYSAFKLSDGTINIGRIHGM